MPWLARQSFSAGDPPGPKVPGIADWHASGTPLTGCPATLTASLEVIQAPGWPGTAVAENTIVCGPADVTFAPAPWIVAMAWLDGRRFGRIHSGVTNWTTAKIA